MRVKRGGYLLSLAAAVAGVSIAIAMGTAGAGAAGQVATLGSTSGNEPLTNICGAYPCTYVPFSNYATPEMQVPFDGTVTSFSIKTDSSTGTFKLRVLRPAGGGRFTGAGTSPAKSVTAAGVTTFAVSLPVQKGDVIGLDNDSSSLMFDNSDPTPYTYYWAAPALADGTTATPNQPGRAGYRLLLSAVVQSSGTTTSTGTSTSTTTTTGPPPKIANPTQSHRTWREGKELPVIARARRAPVGTTFRFNLSQKAQVVFTFTQQLPGRKVKGKCVPPTKRNRHNPRCTRTVVRGTLSFPGHAGTNKVFFQGRLSNGRRLKLGAYTVVITATNTARQRSNRASLRFTIVR